MPQRNRRPSQDSSDLRTESSSLLSPSLSSSTASLAGASPGLHHSTPQTVIIQSQIDINARIQALHHELVSSLLVADPSMWNPSGAGYSPFAHMGDVVRLRSYTATTALCASVCFLLPAESSTNVVLVGQSFLRASREILKLYQDFDVTYPDASSLVIRIYHASALHTDGRTPAAWQSFDEALRLAEQMRLYDERSFEGLEPIEARIRRLAFWQIYILDKYAALVEGKPMRLHPFSIAAPITTKLRAEGEAPLLVPNLRNESAGLEEQLLSGFYLIQRLWSAASEVALDL
ncbi:hypothetical protein BGZ61DRAFT_564556 [Ilyonectria robusta]|uniref:uncharacterized protein n=1 Tax=Ilyonectria robusta TaxID=1079257 RepID=UPI001E8D11F3|nr:uncharacterized protein BGZ61DRAFT_564556 [Ilyonectria robusta]KAH8661059.1 hypothetical protein BGZ61DRAFT_564556 [Ilyonectria robusta]